MHHVKDRIEEQFAAAARLFFRHNLITLLVLTVFTGGLLSQLPKLTLDTSAEGFLHEQDPALLTYNDFRAQFGNTEMVIIAIKGKDVFAPEFLQELKKLHVELRDTVPYVDDISSLINARSTRGEGDRLIVEDLLEHWPESPEELATIKERALTNSLYKNLIISEKGDFTGIVLQMQAYTSQGEEPEDVLAGFTEEADGNPQEARLFLTDEEKGEAVEAVTRIADTYRSPDFEIYVAGGPVVTDFLKKAMTESMLKFMVLVGMVIATFLFLMFRRASAVFLPLLIVLISLLSTMGLMAACGTPLKMPTQIMPSFLLAVGVGDSVHILAIFFHRLRHNGWDKEEAVVYAIGHSGLAVLMTSVTTAGGLLSFASADIAPIADLGIYAASGVMLALLYTIVLLPSLLALISLKQGLEKKKERKGTWLDKVLSAFGHFAIQYPKSILAATVLIFLVSIIGMTRITFSHYIVGWYPKDSPIRIASETIDEEMRGSISLEIILDTGKVNGLYDPDLLRRIDSSVQYMEQLKKGEIFAGKAWSITTILKEIHQALNENRPEFYKVPDDPALIPQEFLLFENSGSDDLEDVTDSQFSKARFTVKVPYRDAVAYTDFLQAVNKHFQQTFPELQITITGLSSIISQTMAQVVDTMAESYMIAFIVITVLMISLIGKLRTGLLSMIPNLFPICLTLGIMGWFHVTMDLFTMLVGSISIGLAVDDTIHFMHNFQRYYKQGGDAKQAVMDTLCSTGRAMLITTCVLSIGFFVLMCSSMNNLFNFGWLTGFTLIIALLADYLIAPALMMLVHPSQQSSNLSFSGELS
ncbi:MAG: efflux RND transporter permease subunit [Candidatus Electrothrix aestuarii]|uniref:Efflux RND transporter permease subunit n=1 Tax=Candidatus Electrothrix aestuarii TaxID=3062594 RepID=A0AAU8LZC2_9BACT|nr:efflux RND transporter permease subunit [Candidatus Electrothrix aestuarii]